MVLRLRLQFLVLLSVFILAVYPAWAAKKRVALVIGNAGYQTGFSLANPVNDAKDIAQQLEKLGFKVTFGTDLHKAAMDSKVRDFAETLPGADVALFFYAGHGLQVSGENYLVPVDAKLANSSALDFEMVRLDLVQRMMERETKTNILVIDACRDNPLARNLARALGTRSASIGKGLAKVEAGEGTLISFSTQPGNVALDGEGRNSPFVDALLKHIAKPGEDLSSILINVRNDVMDATARRQVPWENSALTSKFYFIFPPAPGPGPEQQIEIEFWGSVKNSRNPSVIQAYLNRYPEGIFAPVAVALIKQFEQEANAERAARESGQRRKEEDIKALELRRLEEENRAREARLAEEKRAVEFTTNSAKLKEIEDRRRTAELNHAAELRLALEEVRIAREAAKTAEEQRVAATKAAAEAKKTAVVASRENSNGNQQQRRTLRSVAIDRRIKSQLARNASRPNATRFSMTIWPAYSLTEFAQMSANTKYGKLTCTGGSRKQGIKRTCRWH